MPPELSRPLPLVAVPAAGREARIEATATECAALADRFGIPAVECLQATVHLLAAEDGSVVGFGTLEARVVQLCVVTLEPVPQMVSEAFRWRFLPLGADPQDGPEDDADEIPTAGVADLGEALAEQLSLALDPYPRAPGAVLPAVDAAAATGPFAQLLPLRRRD